MRKRFPRHKMHPSLSGNSLRWFKDEDARLAWLFGTL